MILIGALIGGITNFLAIKMLFRPYKAIYIGKWKLPFTPGLIPKRQKELAVQLGDMVVNHLITPENIKEKFKDKSFQKEMTEWADRQLTVWILTDVTPRDVLQNIHIHGIEHKLTTYIKKQVEAQYDVVKNDLREKTITDILTNEKLRQLEENIPSIANSIMLKIEEFIASEEGKNSIASMVDHYLDKRGKIGGLIKMMVGNMSLPDKIQSEAVKILKKDEAKKVLISGLESEWNKLKKKKLSTIISKIQDDQVLSFLNERIDRIIQIETLLNKPIHEWIAPYKKRWKEKAIPQLIKVVGDYLAEHVDEVLHKLQVADMVRIQVESFSLQRLEQMVLDIARKELKMITFLGALLGGVIGFIQATIVMFFPS